MTDEPTAAPTIPTDEEYQAMKVAAAAYEADQAAKARAAHDDHLAPLREVINSDAYAEVQGALTAALVARYALDGNIDPHLRPLAGFMERLKTAAA